MTVESFAEATGTGGRFAHHLGILLEDLGWSQDEAGHQFASRRSCGMHYRNGNQRLAGRKLWVGIVEESLGALVGGEECSR